MEKHDISRRSFLTAGLGLVGAGLLAGAGCSSGTPEPYSKLTKDLIERDFLTVSVIWQYHAAAVEDARLNGDAAVMDFTAGSPTNPTPDELNQTVIRLLSDPPENLHAYTSPFGLLEVRQKIAAHLAKEYKTTVSAEHLVVTDGASQAIGMALCICCPINAEVAVIQPYYTDYKNLIDTTLCKMVPAPAHRPDFQIDVDALENVLTEKTYAVIVNSPNNPTGAIYTRETLSAVADMLRRKAEQIGHPIYLISDEPYRELLYSDVELPYVPDLYDDTLICYSWSKSLALPGERIGYLYIAENCANADYLLAQVQNVGYGTAHLNANATYARAVAECMGLPVEMDQYTANRTILMEILDDCGYEYVRPDGAFYLWAKAPVEDEMAFCEAAKKHHLYLAPGSGFGQPGYFRACLCVDTEKYKKSRAAFKALMKEFS